MVDSPNLSSPPPPSSSKKKSNLSEGADLEATNMTSTTLPVTYSNQTTQYMTPSQFMYGSNMSTPIYSNAVQSVADPDYSYFMSQHAGQVAPYVVYEAKRATRQMAHYFDISHYKTQLDQGTAPVPPEPSTRKKPTKKEAGDKIVPNRWVRSLLVISTEMAPRFLTRIRPKKRRDSKVYPIRSNMGSAERSTSTPITPIGLALTLKSEVPTSTPSIAEESIGRKRKLLSSLNRAVKRVMTGIKKLTHKDIDIAIAHSVSFEPTVEMQTTLETEAQYREIRLNCLFEKALANMDDLGIDEDGIELMEELVKETSDYRHYLLMSGLVEEVEGGDDETRTTVPIQNEPCETFAAEMSRSQIIQATVKFDRINYNLEASVSSDEAVCPIEEEMSITTSLSSNEEAGLVASKASPTIKDGWDQPSAVDDSGLEPSPLEQVMDTYFSNDSIPDLSFLFDAYSQIEHSPEPIDRLPTNDSTDSLNDWMGLFDSQSPPHTPCSGMSSVSVVSAGGTHQRGPKISHLIAMFEGNAMDLMNCTHSQVTLDQ